MSKKSLEAKDYKNKEAMLMSLIEMLNELKKEKNAKKHDLLGIVMNIVLALMMLGESASKTLDDGLKSIRTNQV